MRRIVVSEGVSLDGVFDAETMGKWAAWFQKAGEKLVDAGSPMQTGLVLHSDGSNSGSATKLNGYSIVQAENRRDVLRLVKDHPFLSIGNGEYTVEIFELPK